MVNSDDQTIIVINPGKSECTECGTRYFSVRGSGYNCSICEGELQTTIKEEILILDNSQAKLEIDQFLKELKEISDVEPAKIKDLRKMYLEKRELDFEGPFHDTPYLSLDELPMSPLTELRILICALGKIKKIRTYPSLVELCISNNQLTEVPELPNLTSLIIENNKLVDIREYPKLEDLHCSKNEIEQIFSENFPILTSLGCNNNKIRKIGYFPRLKSLYCSGNPITILPELPKLEELDISNSFLAELGKHPRLQSLRANDTKLTSLGSYPLLYRVDIDVEDIKSFGYLPCLFYLAENIDPVDVLRLSPYKYDISINIEIDIEHKYKDEARELLEKAKKGTGNEIELQIQRIYDCFRTDRFFLNKEEAVQKQILHMLKYQLMENKNLDFDDLESTHRIVSTMGIYPSDHLPTIKQFDHLMWAVENKWEECKHMISNIKANGN